MKIKRFGSIGGGFSSTIRLPLEMIRKYGAENVHLFIACLAGESPDLWRLVDECEQRTGLHVTRISYHPEQRYIIDAPESEWWNVWKAFRAAGRMGSSLADPCSRMLKRETIKNYLLDTATPGVDTLHVGITSDEIDRMLAIRKNWLKAGFRVEADLEDLPEVNAVDFLGWQPVLYEQGFSHNNCGGFCVKAGHAEFERLLWYYPQLYAYHEEQEQLFQREFNTTATIMRDRKQVKGIKTTYSLSMRDFAIRTYAKWIREGEPQFAKALPGCYFCDAGA